MNPLTVERAIRRFTIEAGARLRRLYFRVRYGVARNWCDLSADEQREFIAECEARGWTTETLNYGELVGVADSDRRGVRVGFGTNRRPLSVDDAIISIEKALDG